MTEQIYGKKELVILKKYAEKTEFGLEELRKRFEDTFVEISKEYAEEPNPKLLKRTMKRFRGELKRESGSLTSTAIQFKGFWMGDTGVLDFVEIMRNAALALYNNPSKKQWAIDKHIVTRDGTPLDNREIVNFKDNPNFRKPLQGNSFYRAAFGVLEFEDKSRFTKLHINDSEYVDPNEFELKLNKPVTFRSTIKKLKTPSPMLELNATSVTKMKYLDEKMDMERMLRECGYTIYKLDELEKAFEVLGKKDTREHPVLINANVPRIFYKPNPKTNNRRIVLDDEELGYDLETSGITCFVPELISLDFGQDSELIVLGSLDKNTFNNKEVMIVNAVGYYPVLKMKKKETEIEDYFSD